MRLKGGRESKIKCDSVGGMQPDALLALAAVQEEMAPVPGLGSCSVCTVATVPSPACFDFLGAHPIYP